MTVEDVKLIPAQLIAQLVPEGSQKLATPLATELATHPALQLVTMKKSTIKKKIYVRTQEIPRALLGL